MKNVEIKLFGIVSIVYEAGKSVGEHPQRGVIVDLKNLNKNLLQHIILRTFFTVISTGYIIEELF